MLNCDKIRKVLDKYKESFESRWEGEKYKWEAAKWFQEHWDVNAKDFGTMLSIATDKTLNLLASMNNFPRKMIVEYAKQEQEAVRSMFMNLYDETKNVVDRIIKFQKDAQELCDILTPGMQHYQRPMAITVYLWLRYPDKYDVFKYSVCKATCQYLENDFVPKKGNTAQNITGNMKLIDELLEAVNKDSELLGLFQSKLDEDCYKDKSHRTLAFDVSFYIANYLNEKEETSAVELYADSSEDDKHYWWLNANPKIWSFSEISVGEEQTYTLYNDNGNKRRIFQNFLDAKAGDLVIGYESNPVKQIVALARITQENDGEKLYFEKVEGLSVPIDYLTLKEALELEKMEYFLNPQGSLFKLTKGEYDFIMDVIREENPVSDAMDELEAYTKEDFLSEVFMNEEKYDTLKNLLLKKQNIIMQGAPGVGKTFAAKRLAYSIMGVKDESRVEFIQFHQNYSYEDFVMGYKPSGEGFELQNGIFYKFCQKAANNPENPYFFIIDEINRGNMSKIFGELLMLIEKDYRGTKATLAYNGLPFSVPKNLYIIGMMNTADRSLAMIDYALRRRFSFFAMEPGFETDGFRAYKESLNDDTFVSLIDVVISLNQSISKDASLGKGFCIGHSYFCGQKKVDEEEMLGWMSSVVDYDILPMLEEYWFDEPDKITLWRNRLQGVFNN